jgi:hypothetical protein
MTAFSAQRGKKQERSENWSQHTKRAADRKRKINFSSG